MKIKLFFTLMLAFLFVSGITKADDYTDAMIKAKHDLRSAINKFDEKEITKVRAQFERILQLKKDVWLVNYYIALADYNLALTGMMDPAKVDPEKVKKYTQSGLAALDNTIDMKEDFADAYILQVFLNFNRWSYEQDKMNEIISASQQAQGMAEKLESSNPRLYLVKGISNFYTPEAFGGGPKTAIAELEKSVSAFSTRKEATELHPDWGNDLALGYMALSVLSRDDDGDKAKAKEYIDKALEISPESGFVKGYVMVEYNKSK